MHVVEARGLELPAVGFGTWQLRGEECREAVAHALSLGYRHLDTARMYRNEREVGQGLRDSGIDRDEVVLTTKVLGSESDRDGVHRSVEESLGELDVDHVDLLLLHQPGGVPVEETMAAFREEQEAGRVRHVGVSNFSVRLLERADAEATIATVQNEYHPGHRQDDVLAWCRERDVALTAYSPLGKGRGLRDDSLAAIGEEHGKTAAQVLIRWLIQQDGVVTIPRSRDTVHREQNLDVFDFELSDDEMVRISGRG